MQLKHLERVHQLTDLPYEVSAQVQTLLQKSLGEKINKVKLNFAYINDVPKRILQYKQHLRHLPDLPILPPVYKYEVLFTFSDTNIKDYQIYIGIDEHFQILHYNLPVNSDRPFKALYGEQEAIKIALDYVVKNGYNIDIETSLLKYSHDKKILIWTIYFLQEKINSKRKKCLEVAVNLYEPKDNIYITEAELVEETISSIEVANDPFEPLPPPPPKKEDV
ncbi:hypothetical protein U0035_13425 [Niabella yanshanensis]|uniref:Uncharacterized protein n=1 Tax=Niabella yanshanensis TaxID=577386 RepID=A0ABZ0W184_9BACT|nr:hypothetical protein [Niabella yanshanensis]WQD36669.1 hypothetical protein U0035_13425 [Niabella yanshanensis]